MKSCSPGVDHRSGSPSRVSYLVVGIVDGKLTYHEVVQPGCGPQKRLPLAGDYAESNLRAHKPMLPFGHVAVARATGCGGVRHRITLAHKLHTHRQTYALARQRFRKLVGATLRTTTTTTYTTTATTVRYKVDRPLASRPLCERRTSLPVESARAAARSLKICTCTEYAPCASCTRSLGEQLADDNNKKNNTREPAQKKNNNNTREPAQKKNNTREPAQKKNNTHEPAQKKNNTREPAQKKNNTREPAQQATPPRMHLRATAVVSCTFSASATAALAPLDDQNGHALAEFFVRRRSSMDQSDAGVVGIFSRSVMGARY
eukprot:1191584-Prorocentrum_minimum.AAC.1